MVLCASSTALVVATGVLFAADLVDEGWVVTGYLLGAPLLVSVTALVGALVARAAPAALVVSVAAAGSLAWAVVTVAGLGLYLLLPALVLCAAAVLLVVAAVEETRGRSSPRQP